MDTYGICIHRVLDMYPARIPLLPDVSVQDSVWMARFKHDSFPISSTQRDLKACEAYSQKQNGGKER
jgi:hypothetical protein